MLDITEFLKHRIEFFLKNNLNSFWKKYESGQEGSKRPVSIVVKDIAIGDEGLGFDSRAGQIEHSVVNGSSPLRRFVGVVLHRS